MEPLKIVKYPHPALEWPSLPIRKINARLRDIVRQMFELMYASEGVGLAANQVAIPYQLFVMNSTGDPEQTEEEYAFLNPLIRRKRGRVEEAEGCLSFPDLRMEIVRADEIDFQATSLDGIAREYTWKGFAARIVQHETDHLRGHCFFERAGIGALGQAREILSSLVNIYMTDQKLGFVPNREEFKASVIDWEEDQR